MSTSEKNMGYVIHKMYPGAYTSFRGNIFRVTDNTDRNLKGIQPDMNETIRLAEKLSTEDGKKLKSKLVNNIRNDIFQDSGRDYSLDANRLKIIVPEVINLQFDKTLSVVYCEDTHCATLFSLDWFYSFPKEDMPLCMKCKKSHVQQAPIFFAQRREDANTSKVMVGAQAQSQAIHEMKKPDLFCPNQSSKGKCKVIGVCPDPAPNASLVVTDPQRPIDSLMIVKNDCPKGVIVEPKRLPRPWRTNEFYFKADFPREQLTTPLSISGVEPFTLIDDKEIVDINEVLSEVLPLKFNTNVVDLKETRFSRLNVLEAVYGFKVGDSKRGLSTYYIGGREQDLIGRLIETQGFVLSFNPNIYTELEKISEKYKSKVGDMIDITLHTLKHALLVLMPQYTGLEPNKFFGSYEYNLENKTAKVYVYDTDEGGSGGYASLMSEGSRFINIINEIKTRLLCLQRECQYACKLCMHIENCGKLNKKLNRNILNDLNVFV